MSSFGLEFKLISDVQVTLDPKIFRGGPWIHLASVARGFKRYMLFKHGLTDQVYLERLDEQDPEFFKKIEDSNELSELTEYLRGLGLLSLGVGKEFKLGAK